MSIKFESLLLRLGRPGRAQIIAYCVLQFQFVFFIASLTSISLWSASPPPESCRAKWINSSDGENITSVSYQADLWSVAMEWDLTCDRIYEIRLSQSLFFSGGTIGGLIFGYLADKYGRKVVCLGSLYSTAILGVIVPIVPSFQWFLAVKIIQGILFQGFNSAANTWKMEMLPSLIRAKVSVPAEAICVSIGMVYLAATAWISRDWRIIELANSLPLLLVVFSFWTMPETLRWLLKNNRKEQAEKVIRQFVKINRLPLPEDLVNELTEITEEISEEKNSDIRDLIRTRRMAVYTAVFCFNWFAWLLVTYGMVLAMPGLSGNLFLNIAVLGFIDLVTRSLTYFVLSRLGRRLSSLAGLCVAGAFLILSVLQNIAFAGYPGSNHAATAIAISARAGSGIFVVTTMIYLSEVYPTPMRCAAYGVCAAAGRFGALLSAQVLLLGDYVWKDFPFLLLGMVSCLAGLTNLLLPETGQKPMPNKVAETLKLNETEKMRESPLEKEMIAFIAPTDDNSVR